MSEAFRLADAVLHLIGPGPISLWPNVASFWQSKDRPELTSGQVLSVFTYSETWDYQERHPDGEELAIVLAGNVDFLVDGGHDETPIHIGSGSGWVVPAGIWHRVQPRELSKILFVTPVPKRTEHRHAEPPGLSF